MDWSRGRWGRVGSAWQAEPCALGRPISEKKRKENRNRLGCQGLLGQNQIGRLRKIKIVFDFLIQRNGIQIKRFKYFQTEFKLDSK
jgi:hypothetical protein